MAYQITTFYLNNHLYGIPVNNVQEVTGPMATIPTPLAPSFVTGLINLRGQIATAVNLKDLLKLPQTQNENSMSVVCKIDGNLVSLLVDNIGEVLDVESFSFEPAPETLAAGVRKLLSGIYKIDGQLLSCIDMDKISKEIFYNSENNDLKIITL